MVRSPLHNVGEVVDVQASRGVIYWLAADGRVYAMSDDQTVKLGKAPVSGQLATEGYLYMLDKERDLFVYHQDLAINGQPVAQHVLQVTAWTALVRPRRQAPRLFRRPWGRYIDRDGDAVALRAVGVDLLVFNERVGSTGLMQPLRSGGGWRARGLRPPEPGRPSSMLMSPRARSHTMIAVELKLPSGAPAASATGSSYT